MLSRYVLNDELFKKLNSATKYPSILTYHEMGKGGCLNDQLSYPQANPEELIYFTEKVDGTNTRLIIKGSDYLIGSREELLHAKGDRIVNPALGICPHLIPIAEQLVKALNLKETDIRVFYGETYGGKITKASREYTNQQQVGFRLFDVMCLTEAELNEVLSQDIRLISDWREQGRQPFVSEAQINQYAAQFGLARVPNLFEKPLATIPTTFEGVSEFLTQYKITQVGLDKAGHSEGLIGRNATRDYIVKLRFEDYERTLKKLKR